MFGLALKARAMARISHRRSSRGGGEDRECKACDPSTTLRASRGAARKVHPERRPAKGRPNVTQQARSYQPVQQTVDEECGLDFAWLDVATAPHIRVRNLNLFYGKEQALSDITVEAPNRQITAIIGPSGCGKTSFLKCLNRLTDLVDGVRVRGEVLVDGVNIYDPGADVIGLRKRMGLLSQRPAPLPMSIYDNVAYGPRIHGIRKRTQLNEIVERNLYAAGLWEEVRGRLRKPASGLSIGQQQRLCLARCLAVEPEIILADEPTSALDPISAKKIADMFLELKDRYTIILVTHNLRIAKRLADYVIFLYLGELVEQGPKHEFFSNPRRRRTISYIQGEF